MKKMNRRVVVGMSGGVDSTVSAYLLKQQGYDVHGVTFAILDEESSDVVKSAADIAKTLGVPHQTLNLKNEFSDSIIEYFKHEYLNGRTPNPCVVCNAAFKWASLLKYAREIEADYVATGHYATIQEQSGYYQICFGKDASKDQSYVLWRLSQEALKKTLFPLGKLTKPEVREIARQLGLKNSDLQDSFEICFIPDDDYAKYLRENIPFLDRNVKNGEIVDQNGKVLGLHKGYPFYTIGQRRGLGISTPEPVYVNHIDAKNNQIVVGPVEKLLNKRLKASQTNWFIPIPESHQLECEAKIRYKDAPHPCHISFKPGSTVEVAFHEPKRAITPGQAVVFYLNDCMIGGGFIDDTLP